MLSVIAFLVEVVIVVVSIIIVLPLIKDLIHHKDEHHYD